MTKVAIYCRLSDEDRNKLNKYDDSESIQNQKTLLTKYAVNKGWDIYKIYSDDDYSGLDKNRPEFNMLLEDARKGEFDIVLCKHQSRFSRDIEITEKYLNRKFPEWGIRFISITDNVDTLDKSNKKSRQINGLINEWYCEDISESIKATFKVKREEGKFIGSFATYGYMKDPNDKNRLIIDEKAAEVVKTIYNWYLSGYGTQKIAYLLNDKGIPNPTKYKQSKGLKFKNSSQTDGYGLWNKTTIRRILRNEMYMGTLVQGKREKVNYKSKKIIPKPKEQWIKVDNNHQSIIDKHTFNQVQERLNSRVRSTGTGKAHIFAGKVRCMDCESTMIKVTAGNGYQYLRCKLYVRDPKKKLCTSHSIRLDKLEELVMNKLRGYVRVVNDNSIELTLRDSVNIESRSRKLEKNLIELNKKLAYNDLVVKNLYLDKVNEVITSEQFAELNKNFSEEKVKLLETKRNLNDQINTCEIENVNINKWKGILIKYKNFEKMTHLMVNELIDYIKVGEKKVDNKIKIVVYWNY